MSRFSVIVCDASPLITLAAADALDKLALPGLQIVVPDMVYLEATRDATRLGAAEIVRWYRANPGLIEIAPTDTFQDHQAVLLVRPTAKVRNKGEEAAIEVLRSRAAADESFIGLLLFEDSDLLKSEVSTRTPSRVKLVSTHSFLSALENARLIQSADEILERAVKRGRIIRESGYDDPELATKLARQWSDQNGD